MTELLQERVTVRIGHRANTPVSCNTYWVTPVDWEPTNPIDEPEFVLENGSVWSDVGEEAGIALFTHEQYAEGQEVVIPLSDLSWLEIPSCLVLSDVVIDR